MKKEVGAPSRSRELERSEGRSVDWRRQKKVYSCSVPRCGKTYASVWSLRRHKQDSHGPKEICSKCGRAYKKSFLRKHLKNCKTAPEEYDSDECEKMGRELEGMI